MAVIRRKIRFENEEENYKLEQNRRIKNVDSYNEDEKDKEDEFLESEKISSQNSLEDDEIADTTIFHNNSSDERSILANLERRFEYLVESNRNDLLGVFGVNSDIAISRLAYKSLNCIRECVYLGEVDVLQSVDIYSSIIACIYNYVIRELENVVEPYYIREVYYKLLECNEYLTEPDEEFYTPFDKLNRLRVKQEAPKEINTILELLTDIIIRSFQGVGSQIKYVITINIDENFTYKNIKKLYNMRSENIIIIVKSIFDFELLNMKLDREFDTYSNEESYIYKFFSSSNIFNFNNVERSLQNS